MNCKKFFRSFCMTLVSLVLICSVTASAATPIPLVAWKPTSLSGLKFYDLFVDAGDYYELPVLAMAGRSEAEIASWLRIMDTFQGKNPDKVGFMSILLTMTGDPTGGNQQTLRFGSFEKSSLFFNWDNGVYGFVQSNNSDVVQCVWKPYSGVFSPDVFTFSGLPIGQNTNTSKQNQYGVILLQAGASYDLSTLTQPSTGTFRILYWDDDKNIMIRDDLEKPEPPEPPVSSSEPEPPKPDPPKEPEIPAGDPTYVPYDTSVWKKFLSHVKGSIGSSTNVGFLIFAAIMGVLIIKKIVSKFTHS